MRRNITTRRRVVPLIEGIPAVSDRAGAGALFGLVVALSGRIPAIQSMGRGKAPPSKHKERSGEKQSDHDLSPQEVGRVDAVYFGL